MPPKSTRKKQSTAKRARSPEDAVKPRPSKRSKKASAPDETNSADGVSSTGSPKATAATAKSPALSGKFDLYAMELPFLAEVYLPAGETKPQFAALHKTILKYQAKPDFTAQALIPDASSGKAGRLSGAVLEDPMEGMPWDIAIVDLKAVDSLVFSAKERSGFLSAPEAGAGIVGRTALAQGHCGVQSASGVFRMKHAWTGPGTAAAGKDVDIFEGYLSFNVVHSGLYRRKGHGGGDKIDFAFWAVRARQNAAGLEIGLTEIE
ncbi:hypothetical protein DFH07DRAFT_910827 [Mycena maculata]|uniref:Uncharacterized protein n=1 Tax=Mycena maculata TaxID=230809 RepID=A0AAD7K6N0_9AGAR|nr:hypothetical protein DFH07DRAFT_910827 [Mycena maculata]